GSAARRWVPGAWLSASAGAGVSELQTECHAVKAIGRHRVNFEPVPPAPFIGGVRGPGAGGGGGWLVGGVTKLAHLVTPDEMVAGHQRGDYVGFCGDRFQAASLVEPGRGPCQPCQQRATSS